MATEFGVSEWRQQSKRDIGRPKAIESPEAMWKLACKYFADIDEKPFLKQEAIKSGDFAGTTMEVETIRPYTINGFEVFLFKRSIISDIWDYRKNTDEKYNDYQPVMRAIEKIIFDQKFSGAAVGAFNSNIIVRELGLADSTKVEVVKEQPLFGPEDEEDLS